MHADQQLRSTMIDMLVFLGRPDSDPLFALSLQGETQLTQDLEHVHFIDETPKWRGLEQVYVHPLHLHL